MFVTLAAMLGQIGLPGGGFGLSYHYASGGAPAATAGVLGVISDGGKAKEGAAWLAEGGAATIPCARVVDMLLNPGKEFDFNGKRDRYPNVKLAYWVGGDPFAHHPQRNRQLEAWRNLETFVYPTRQCFRLCLVGLPNSGQKASNAVRFHCSSSP